MFQTISLSLSFFFFQFLWNKLKFQTLLIELTRIFLAFFSFLTVSTVVYLQTNAFNSKKGKSNAIELSRIQLPTLVQLGSPVQLACDFRLESSESLYSVKWYKNSMEFFRYIAPGSGVNLATQHQTSSPKTSPAAETRGFTAFAQNGINLDVSKVTFHTKNLHKKHKK